MSNLAELTKRTDACKGLWLRDSLTSPYLTNCYVAIEASEKKYIHVVIKIKYKEGVRILEFITF